LPAPYSPHKDWLEIEGIEKFSSPHKDWLEIEGIEKFSIFGCRRPLPEI
jgi:hypothetical protein